MNHGAEPEERHGNRSSEEEKVDGRRQSVGTPVTDSDESYLNADMLEPIEKPFTPRRRTQIDDDIIIEEYVSTSSYSSCSDDEHRTLWAAARSSFSNSFFARQLIYCTFLILLVDALAVCLIIVVVAHPVSTRWYTRNTSRPNECVIQPIAVNFLGVLNVVLGLPAIATLGSPKFRLYQQHFNPATGNPSIVMNRMGEWIGRTRYLEICEFLAVLEVLYLAFLAVAFIVLTIKDNGTRTCIDDGSSAEVMLFLLTVVNYLSVIYQLVLFARFRAHQKMQLGVFAGHNPLSNQMKKVGLFGSNGTLRVGDSEDRYEPRTPNSATSDHSNVESPPGPQRQESSSEIDMKRRKLRSALLQAVEGNNLIKVQTLIANATSAFGSSAFLREMYKTPYAWFNLFAQTTLNPLHLACSKGNVQMVDTLLRSGMSPNELDNISKGRRNITDAFEFLSHYMLHTQEGKLSSSTMLRTGIGMILASPLHVAVINGHVEIAEILINKGADVDRLVQTSFLNRKMRVPPLFLADSVAMAKCLLHHRANLLLVPSDSKSIGKQNAADSTMTITVLQYAELQDHLALRGVFETWGGDVALTPLHTAAGAGNVAAVKSYIEYGVFLDAMGEYYDGVNQRTPLHWAAVMGRSQVISLLLRSGANPNALDRFGRSPLHWAARSHDVESVKALITFDADPTITDYHGNTVIAIATADNIASEGIIQTLVDGGADINARSDTTGDTALHVAMKSHFLRSALALLHCGADINCVDADGRKPLDYTVSAELQFTIKKEVGANDVRISYTPAYASFARKIRDGIQENFITASMTSDRNVDAILKSIENVSVVVSILSKDYETSEYCLSELACAKQLDIPVIGIFCDRTDLSDELQVYLYTRQIVPFHSTIQYSNYDRQENHMSFEYDEDKFHDYLRCLLDGLRDEIEIHRRNGGNRTAFGQHSDSIADEMLESRADLSGGLIPDRSMINVFLAHGDCHRDFVGQLYRNLVQSGIRMFLDSSRHTTSLKERILVAKDAILCCSIFMVVLSPESVKTPILSDQLAYAEDKDKPIVPIILSEIQHLMEPLDMVESESVIMFSEDLGFEQGLIELHHRLRYKFDAGD